MFNWLKKLFKRENNFIDVEIKIEEIYPPQRNYYNVRDGKGRFVKKEKENGKRR